MRPARRLVGSGNAATGSAPPGLARGGWWARRSGSEGRQSPLLRQQSADEPRRQAGTPEELYCARGRAATPTPSANPPRSVRNGRPTPPCRRQTEPLTRPPLANSTRRRREMRASLKSMTTGDPGTDAAAPFPHAEDYPFLGHGRPPLEVAAAQGPTAPTRPRALRPARYCASSKTRNSPNAPRVWARCSASACGRPSPTTPTSPRSAAAACSTASRSFRTAGRSNRFRLTSRSSTPSSQPGCQWTSSSTPAATTRPRRHLSRPALRRGRDREDRHRPAQGDRQRNRPQGNQPVAAGSTGLL